MPSLRFIFVSIGLVTGIYLLGTAPDARGAAASGRFDQPPAMRALMSMAVKNTSPEVQEQIADALAQELARATHDQDHYFQ